MGQDVEYSRPFGGSLELMLFNNPFVTETVDLLLAYTSDVA
jgi:hypothetical protein